MIRPPPRSPLFPSPPLSRSEPARPAGQLGLGWMGSTIENVDPLPSTLSTAVSPPCAITMRRTLGSPMPTWADRKSTRLNSSHLVISYAVFCLKKKKKTQVNSTNPDGHSCSRSCPDPIVFYSGNENPPPPTPPHELPHPVLQIRSSVVSCSECP